MLIIRSLVSCIFYRVPILFLIQETGDREVTSSQNYPVLFNISSQVGVYVRAIHLANSK